MSYVVGVDAGQSSTVAALAATDSGGELGRGVGPPADLVGEPEGSPRQAAAIAAAVHDVLARVGLAAETPLAAIVVGLTGHHGSAPAPALPFRGAVVRVVHDSVAAHEGALGGEPGIVAVAGTGSVVLGLDARRGSIRTGGWGYLFGDEGSAFALGRAAVALAMRREDGAEDCAFRDLACEGLGVETLRAVQDGVARGTIGRPAVAALAARVLALADRGDLDALAVARSGAHGLSESVRAAHRRLAPADVRAVSYAGGLFANRTYVRLFTAALADDDGAAALLVVAPIGDGAAGAVAMALELAGGPGGASLGAFA